MTSKKIVVALGGNAILKDDPSAAGQQATLRETAAHLVKFIENGDKLIITHGNGPQVGNLLLQNIAADSDKNPAFPLDSLVAMTQGSIGYWLQSAMQNELAKRKLDKSVVSMVTQVIVGENDPAFDKPTKPIGPFYTEKEAKVEMAKSGATFVEDAGRGWRKVVASPKPVAIKELVSIRDAVNHGHVVIAAGGGGIPVIEKDGQLEGKEAVIDKDFASQILAKDLDADMFVVLTGVDNVYINFNKDNQQKLDIVTVDELDQYIAEDQFAAGSMLPKIQAAQAFVKDKPASKAIITSLENLSNLIENEEGTIIVKDRP